MNEMQRDVSRHDRGWLRVDGEECKGCGLCVEACPLKLIRLREELNHYGYRTAEYVGAGCTGCGICFTACPEPGAITVFHAVSGTVGAHGREMNMGGAGQCASS